MTPISVPLKTPQPNTRVYPVLPTLALYQTYTWDSYVAAFGQNPANWDPSRPVKSWFDSNYASADPTDIVTFKVLARDAAGLPIEKQMVLTAGEVCTVNLTGTPTYPPYVVLPTLATRGPGTLSAQYLATPDQARQMVADLGLAGTVDIADQGADGSTGPFDIVYPSNEPRRLLYFPFKGQPQYVGLLLLMRESHGIGSPGKWDTSGSAPMWIPDPTPASGVGDTRPPRAMPIRDLLSGEKLMVGTFGEGEFVTNTNIQDTSVGSTLSTVEHAALMGLAAHFNIPLG